MSFLKKAKLALESGKAIAKDLIEGNELTVSDEEIERRLAICRGCEHFDVHWERCNECGCFMKVKSKLSSVKCPLDKWYNLDKLTKS